MPTDRDHPERLDELSPEGARQCLIRFLGRQDLAEHEEIYDELATEYTPKLRISVVLQ
ncbi:hypothetical protein [Halobellus sp. H-GB7]|uniref:hypothetical protein n=1 Tax=Halobellus sp. H-GB7 TaxID=3069756 RepID=UPI0027B53BBE|nr:hypothetical protein [Halobellus sp. H-GB7]MDQ2055992.1 hypothetical protein [Halobellus sp. H-GB7]